MRAESVDGVGHEERIDVGLRCWWIDQGTQKP
jgi:hypothetical protein